MLQWSIQHIKKKNLVSALMKFALLWKTDIQYIIKTTKRDSRRY